MRLGVQRSERRPLSAVQLRSARMLLGLLVAAEVALAGTWLAGVEGVAWPTRLVTVWMTATAVWLAHRENPETLRERSASPTRLLGITVLLVLAVVALLVVFR